MIQIKSWAMGMVLFESSAETIGEALVEAINKGVSLRASCLNGANLSGINISGTNLKTSDLSGVDFTGSILCGVDFFCANLSGADFSSSNLTGASFLAADLRNAKFSDETIMPNGKRWAAYRQQLVRITQALDFPKKLDPGMAGGLDLQARGKRYKEIGNWAALYNAWLLDYPSN